MTSSSSVRVFAYGSNLCVERILARTPSVEVAAIGTIEGYRFAFHKRSADGSAKADAFLSGDPSDQVWGVVYTLSERDKRVLDGFEGLGVHYDQRLVEVSARSGDCFEAWVYVARPEHIDETVLPFDWYRYFCVHGAAQHGFPQEYRARMAAVEARADFDPQRERREQSVFEGPLVELGARLLERAR